jgi:hypothetical protein
VQVNSPGLVPGAIDKAAGTISPAETGSEIVTDLVTTEEGPVHPTDATPTRATPVPVAGNVTLLLAPVPEMDAPLNVQLYVDVFPPDVV